MKRKKPVAHLCNRCEGTGWVSVDGIAPPSLGQTQCPDCGPWRDALARAEQRELDAIARLDEARALLRRRHGMECPTYDDATGTCGGCEVSVFLGAGNAP